jgi:hypothetical protein
VRYDGRFLVEIDGRRVQKEATVQLNIMHRVGDKPVYHLTINTPLTKDEYEALVQSAMNAREKESEANTSTR